MYFLVNVKMPENYWLISVLIKRYGIHVLKIISYTKGDIKINLCL